LNSRLLDEIQYQPGDQSGHYRSHEQGIQPESTRLGGRRSQVTQLLFSC
jgi:hypothetical protein